jgi:hypothetical protein
MAVFLFSLVSQKKAVFNTTASLENIFIIPIGIPLTHHIRTSKLELLGQGCYA